MIPNKILILKPQTSTSCLLKSLLRRHGYEVVEKAIIKEYIVETVLESKANVIIMNSFQQETDSLKACKVIKNHSDTKNIPMIIQMHDCTDKQKLDFINLGIEDYIRPPFHESEIILKIKNQFKTVKLRNNLISSKKALEESLSMIENQKSELDRNLSMAAKIQEALIPKTLGNIPNCSFLWHFQPSGKVGGDIFDAFMLDDDHMGMYMIDVMGHGIASSMLAVALSESLILDIERGSPLKRKINNYPYYEIVSPIEVIHYLNKRFPYSKYKHYFTIFYMVLNVKTGVLKYVRAAHPAPLLITSDGEIKELDGYGTPIGFEFAVDYEEKTVCLDSGNTIIIYTDGLMEIENEEGQKMEYDGLMNYFRKEVQNENHHFTLNIKRLSRNQPKLKDDLSIFEMKWIKFV
ncbi:SpoIIE family protein phosphatase [Alkaliphilus hydrothermalis]|uniref:Stage 0 sporulation protein A homolog n=1 Tax=Alkaliphilus hydrothermalis TaxID=1482730 RepID=A0ABS2NTM1_9FIRM|nr:response regulator [Alkaliphilus hydrothermalis]MBM7616288.1 sigma-B regulation protein RsbU (phosphoserine phosphatase) [Alkaliphilus hydrothermalis]